jgi:hypothetical protein
MLRRWLGWTLCLWPKAWYKHTKRHSAYVLLGCAQVQTSLHIEEGDVLVIYRGTDGQLWARPRTEFFDGRFERLP